MLAQVTNASDESCNDEIQDWLSDETPIDALTITFKCSVLTIGCGANALILWVIRRLRRSPANLIMTHQCIVACLDATLCVPLFFLSRAYHDDDMNLAAYFFFLNMHAFMGNWVFQSVTTMVHVIARSTQICRLSSRGGISYSATRWWMALAWLLASAASLPEVVRTSLALADPLYSDDYEASHLKIFSFTYVGVVFLTWIVIGVCNLKTVRFLKQNANLVSVTTGHCRRAMGTISIGFLSTCFAQVGFDWF